MDVNQNVSRNVRRIREEKKLTLEAVAAMTGVSRSMLSQIEKGDANPTIAVLWKIANGLKVSFTTLIEGLPEDATVVPAAEIAPLPEDGGRFINYPIFPFDEKKRFETYRIVLEPDGTLAAQPHLAGTEEYITVFTGVLDITVGGELYRLAKGDSIRFKADVEHTYRNGGSEMAELSMIIHYSEQA